MSTTDTLQQQVQLANRVNAETLKRVADHVTEKMKPYRLDMVPGYGTLPPNEARFSNSRALELWYGITASVGAAFGMPGPDAEYAVSVVAPALRDGAIAAGTAPTLCCRVVVGHREVPVSSQSEHAEVNNVRKLTASELKAMKPVEAYNHLAAMARRRAASSTIENKSEAFMAALAEVSREEPVLERIASQATPDTRE